MTSGRETQDWSRLARYVVSRRTELGYQRQTDLVRTSSIGLRTLGSIESAGRAGYNRSTLAALEQSLRWKPGSIDRILAGDEPIESPEAPGSSHVDTESPLNDEPPPFELLDRTERMIWDMTWESREWRWDTILKRRERERHAG